MLGCPRNHRYLLGGEACQSVITIIETLKLLPLGRICYYITEASVRGRWEMVGGGRGWGGGTGGGGREGGTGFPVIQWPMHGSHTEGGLNGYCIIVGYAEKLGHTSSLF